MHQGVKGSVRLTPGVTKAADAAAVATSFAALAALEEGLSTLVLPSLLVLDRATGGTTTTCLVSWPSTARIAIACKQLQASTAKSLKGGDTFLDVALT